jgi:hypothetical protein
LAGTRNINRVLIVIHRRSVLIDGQQERASEPMHFGFGPALLRGPDHRISELIEPQISDGSDISPISSA